MLGLTMLACWSWATGSDARRLLVSWDAQWYAAIANNGYGLVRVHEDGRHLSDYAFFPLFPWLERLVGAVTGLPVLDAGLLISAVASLVAAWGVFAVGAHLYDRRVGVLLVALWAALPVGIVLSMAYSESLFTALAAWSLYSVLTRRWIWAGVLASFAGMTRPLGLAVAMAVLLPAVVALLRHRHQTSVGSDHVPVGRVLVGALVAPLGWLGYVGWVGLETGGAFGYFRVAGGWANGFDGGAAFSRWIWALLTSSAFVLGVLACAGVALLVWLFVLCVRNGLPLPLLVFCGCLVLLTLTTSGYFGSKPRYLLPAFPLLLPVALTLDRLRSSVLATVLALVSIASATYGAFWLHGPGPP